MIRHICFGRSISRKLAAAVMAVSLLARTDAAGNGSGGYRRCCFCQE